MTSPLDGIRVMDFTQVQQGPTCTLVLADFGADVIKIEGVERGEFYRHEGPPGKVRGFPAPFLSLNRNKKSIGVDLKHPDGKKLIYQLAEKSDVVVENFRPGVMDRLGIGYEALSKINPRIIFASSSGYGQTGPYSGWKGQDVIGQAVAGTPLLNGYADDPPSTSMPHMADLVAGHLLAEGVLLALLARAKTGKGQRIETSLINGMIAADMQRLTAHYGDAEFPDRSRRRKTDLWPISYFETKEGPMIMATGMFIDDPLRRYCEVLGIEDLTPKYPTADEQNEHGPEIRAIFQERFLTRPTSEWLPLLGKMDLIAAPVNQPDDLLTDPQVQHYEMIIDVEHPAGGTFKTPGFPVKMSGTPAKVRYAPPRLGQHTAEVLDLLGYSEEEAARLVEQKVVNMERSEVPAGT